MFVPAVELLKTCLIVLCAKFEIGLGMVAYGTDLGSLRADDDMSAVAALPDAVAVT